jgi:hypothetical protein
MRAIRRSRALRGGLALAALAVVGCARPIAGVGALA